MTKYEWERQLKKGISGLPKAEQQRVLDYYNELFADKIDAGLREQYIISEFGNPYDVANKILVDYYNGDKENPEVDAYIYADSDDIDDAFDEEPAPVTVQAPQRKTWAERREEKRDERKMAHEERIHQHDMTTEPDADDKKSKKGAASASGLITVIAVLIFFVFGAIGLWHPAWLVFLLIPCVITLIEAYRKHNWKIFAYPVFVAFLYLATGCIAHVWHPTWLLFITIPVYYVLGDFITKNANKGTDKQPVKQQPQRPADEPASTPTTQKAKKTKESGGSGFARAMSIIAKILLTLCLVWVSVVVIGLVITVFSGGIGLVICSMASFTGATNGLTIGIGLAQLGLGIVCVFGMIALFKPCINMCKSFVKTIKKSFDGK